MPIEINGQVYYRPSEVCLKAGISRATLYRWLKKGIIKQLRRDLRGWRLFTEDDLTRIQSEFSRIEVEDISVQGR